MWTTTENWVNKQKGNRIIMLGDLNCAHQGCRWEYAQPLNKDIGTADNKLENFLQTTSSDHDFLQTTRNRNLHGKARNAARRSTMLLLGTTTSHPRPPDPFLSLIKSSITAKYGPNCLTLTSLSRPTRLAPPSPTSPNGLTQFSLNAMWTTGKHELNRKFKERWR